MNSLQNFIDAQREYEIERQDQAMVDDSQAGNVQQARWHREKMRELVKDLTCSQISVG